MTALTSRSRRPRILVAHPWMGRGGSEATAMWSLQALQDKTDVTFTTASLFNPADFNRWYGTQVSSDKIRFQPASKLPGVSSGTQLVHWQLALFERHCRRLAPDFDACISAYNPIDFGRPGIQLVGDLSFDELSRQRFYPNANDRICHRQSFLRRLYLKAGDCLRGRGRPPLAERGDCVVANSSWNSQQLKTHFGLDSLPVLYPPCAPGIENAADSHADRDPSGFVCLGRISPEKEIERVITILDRVREAGFPVTLDLVGQFGDDDYARRIRTMADARSEWIRLPGFLGPAEKAALFQNRTFAIHGCRVESFGIAVAEMAMSGLIPFVPSEGASSEIAREPALIYEGEDDAVKKIIAQLQSPETQQDRRQALHAHTHPFLPESFMSGLNELVRQFLGTSISAPSRDPHVAKTFAAAH